MYTNVEQFDPKPVFLEEGSTDLRYYLPDSLIEKLIKTEDPVEIPLHLGVIIPGGEIEYKLICSSCSAYDVIEDYLKSSYPENEDIVYDEGSLAIDIPGYLLYSIARFDDSI